MKESDVLAVKIQLSFGVIKNTQAAENFSSAWRNK